MVARRTLLLPKDKGGLGLVSVPLKAKALFLKVVRKALVKPQLPASRFALYWIGLALRRIDAESWSNLAPHSLDSPPHYTEVKRMLISLRDVDIEWKSNSVAALYAILLEAESIVPRCESGDGSVDWSSVWKAIHNPLLTKWERMTSWHAAHNSLKTRKKLHSWKGFVDSSSCPRDLCQGEESVQHLFWECPVISEAWMWLENLVAMKISPGFSITRSFALWGLVPGGLSSRVRRVLQALAAIMRSFLWRTRCECVFEGKRFSGPELVTSVWASPFRRDGDLADNTEIVFSPEKFLLQTIEQSDIDIQWASVSVAALYTALLEAENIVPRSLTKAQAPTVATGTKPQATPLANKPPPPTADTSKGAQKPPPLAAGTSKEDVGGDEEDGEDVSGDGEDDQGRTYPISLWRLPSRRRRIDRDRSPLAQEGDRLAAVSLSSDSDSESDPPGNSSAQKSKKTRKKEMATGYGSQIELFPSQQSPQRPTKVPSKGGDVDVACLQECHVSSLADRSAWSRQWGNKAVWSLGTNSARGVGVLVSQRWSVVSSKGDMNGRVVSVLISDGMEKFNVVNVYAPNVARDRAVLFSSLHEYMYPNASLVLAGDFNCVLDPTLDRHTVSLVSPGSRTQDVIELKSLCEDLGLLDSWRAEHPAATEYTWRSPSNSTMSRLDRIYVSDGHSITAEIVSCPFSDHDANVTIVESTHPVQQGKGVWKCNVKTLSVSLFVRELTE
ncbi:Hypp9429 [Branchiostoma lanceolatum]|uniref:exodeoxyribonuclease III n=1 Tax=Branchiostoma lanceolatum TaxID=7740 RepID=A0A8S4MLW5_BRALA|nr:Hypp9429 [Branchiostoma lanceolatum]